MAEHTDRSSLLGNQRTGSSSLGPTPSYAETEEQRTNPVTRLMQLAFVVVVVLMVLISVILSFVQASKVNGLLAMLGLSLLGMCAVVLLLARFIKNGDLPRDKAWFLYVIGGCILLEAIFTDVLVYQG